VTAAELVKLADWIDQRLDNEHVDRQAICEDVAARLRLMAGDTAPTGEQRAVLAAALADAVSHREPSGFCADCETHPAGLCEDHAGDLDKADAYLTLASGLGVSVTW
jgi:hypothetical protein